MLDHNLLLLNKFMKHTYDQQLLAAYIQQPCHIHAIQRHTICQTPNRRLEPNTLIHEGNPNKDMLINKPTLQIKSYEMHIFDQTGANITTVHLSGIRWLWDRFNKSHHLTNFLQPTTRFWIINTFACPEIHKHPTKLKTNNPKPH